jgi:hypothetical protein
MVARSMCFVHHLPSHSLKLLCDRAIENLYNAMVEILQRIMDHTGWVTTLLTGGLRPSLGGELDLLM